jgi:hypothetical protein
LPTNCRICEIQDYGLEELAGSMKSAVEHLKAIETSLKAQQGK